MVVFITTIIKQNNMSYQS